MPGRGLLRAGAIGKCAVVARSEVAGLVASGGGEGSGPGGTTVRGGECGCMVGHDMGGQKSIQDLLGLQNFGWREEEGWHIASKMLEMAAWPSYDPIHKDIRQRRMGWEQVL